jgi:uncharacterized Zn-finger protein
MTTTPDITTRATLRLDMAKNPEIISVPHDCDGVRCDGGHPSLGHPAVFYNFAGQAQVECGYCDRVFIREQSTL